ncbi:hypothetical protein [Thalassoroseus pseudoceratinae]|uniref:hypothetical protein n=1 Tax=Thalassoroseus pseudoceratinae TaxID=2713176 RepID=UPI0014225FAA|nr:hypothetical protein [Thalassoroseus pseudoceratinae]
MNESQSRVFGAFLGVLLAVGLGYTIAHDQADAVAKRNPNKMVSQSFYLASLSGTLIASVVICGIAGATGKLAPAITVAGLGVLITLTPFVLLVLTSTYLKFRGIDLSNGDQVRFLFAELWTLTGPLAATLPVAVVASLISGLVKRRTNSIH